MPQEERSGLKVALQMINACGLHPKNTTKWGYILRYATICNLLIMIPLVLAKIVQSFNDVDNLAPSCEALMSVYQLSVKTSFFIINKHQLIELLNLLEQFWMEDFITLDKKTAKEIIFLKTASWANCVVFRTGAILLFCAFTIKIFLGMQPLSCWLPNGGESPFSEIATLVEIFLILMSVLCVGGFDSLLSALLVKIAIQFKLLTRFLQVKGCKDESNLKQFVEQHVFLLKFCRKLESSFTFYILNQYLMSVVTFCMELYIFTESSSFQVTITSFVYIFQMLYEVLLLSVSATCIQIQSETLSQCIYNLDWPDFLHTRYTKDITILLMNSQKPVQFSAGGFLYLNNSLLVRIWNTSMSFYMLMKNRKSYSLTH